MNKITPSRIAIFSREVMMKKKSIAVLELYCVAAASDLQRFLL
jgi:hypothetical protein